MLHRTYSAIPLGMDSARIEIEAVSTQGVPSFILIGLPNRAVDESRERITSALLHCGIRIRSKRTIVNLAPADLKKTNNALELGIAVAMLKMYGEIDVFTDKTLFLGELSLNGKIKPVTGALALVMAAKKMGFESVVFPEKNTEEVSVVSGIELFPLSHLKDFIAFGKKKKKLVGLSPVSPTQKSSQKYEVDFSSIHDQKEAKRALEIAIAGGHNMLMIGPPGAGKSLLAKASVSILPKLSSDEMVEVNQVYSLAGLITEGLVSQRPFRSPHHTTSKMALVGGGSSLKPGEISLAHRGVLFLDELPEFSRDSLESLRLPLEDKKLTIARVEGVFTFPASFMLIAVANPCPCGYYQSMQNPCDCSDIQVKRYKSKLSGPLMDRIDIHIRVNKVKISTLQESIYKGKNKEEVSNVVAKRVEKAREKQRVRYEGSLYSPITNADLSVEQIKKWCVLDDDSQELLGKASNKLNLSARSYFKIVKVARTIADLEGEDNILLHHVAEAVGYRMEV